MYLDWLLLLATNLIKSYYAYRWHETPRLQSLSGIELISQHPKYHSLRYSPHTTKLDLSYLSQTAEATRPAT